MTVLCESLVKSIKTHQRIPFDANFHAEFEFEVKISKPSTYSGENRFGNFVWAGPTNCVLIFTVLYQELRGSTVSKTEGTKKFKIYFPNPRFG